MPNGHTTDERLVAMEVSLSELKMNHIPHIMITLEAMDNKIDKTYKEVKDSVDVKHEKITAKINYAQAFAFTTLVGVVIQLIIELSKS